MKRLLLALFILSALCQAQTVTYTGPTTFGQSMAFQSTLTCSVSSISTLSYVQYTIDGQPGPYARATEPHSCPSATWNAYLAGNGPHIFGVAAYDILATVLATSANVSGNVWNYLPQQTCTFSATPTNACGDILVTAQPTASMSITGNANTLLAVLSLKPSTTITVRAKGVTATNVGPAQTTVTGDALVVYARWQSDTQTATCVTDGAISLTAGTLQHATAHGFTGQFFYALNVTGRTNDHVTCTASSGASFLAVHQWDLAGALTSSAIDLNVNLLNSNWGSAPPSTTIPITAFTLATANEYVLAAGTWDAAPTITPGSGYPTTTIDMSGNSSMVEAATISPNQSWFGLEALGVTVEGANNGNAKAYEAFVDSGNVFAGEDTATSKTFYVNTDSFNNAAHHVVVSVITDANGPGITGAWAFLGGWESQQTFANGTPMELRMSARDAHIVCAGAIPASCAPATVTISGTDWNTDGTSGAATISGAGCGTSSATAVATVALSAGNCVWTPVGIGSAKTTVTDSLGLTRDTWVYVVKVNNYPHFTTTPGTLNTTWGAGSLVLRSQFGSASSMYGVSAATGSALPGYQAAQFLADYKAGGWTALEGLMDPLPGPNWPVATVSGGMLQSNSTIDTSTESVFASQAAANITAYCSALSGTSLFPYLIGDSWAGSNGIALFHATRSWTSWTTPPLTKLYQAWHSGSCNPIGGTIIDEVSSQEGSFPTLCIATSGCTIGNNSWSQLQCGAGSPGGAGTCTGTWANWPGFGCPTCQNFIITGSGVTQLDYNTGSGTPATYTVTSSTTNTFLFSVASVPARTFTASSMNCGPGGTSSCASMEIHPLARNTYNAAQQAGTDLNGTCDGAGSGGPCIDWNRYNAFTTFYGRVTAVSGHAPMAWAPIGAGNVPVAEQNYCGSVGASTIADYCDFYNLGNQQFYTASNSSPIASLKSTNGDIFRNSYGIVADRAILMLGSGVMANYSFHGYPVAVSTCTNSGSGANLASICTSSAAHNLYNVFSGFTRATLIGATSGNVNYFVISSPTATTISLALQNATATDCSACTSGTVTFSDTNAYTLTGTFYFNGGGFFSSSGVYPAGFKNERGKTFTITGTTGTMTNGTTWVYSADSSDPVVAAGLGDFAYQIPSLSSTGGTLYILPDDYGKCGPQNYCFFGAPASAASAFVNVGYNDILGGAGGRSAYAGQNLNEWDRTFGGNPYSSSVKDSQSGGYARIFNSGNTNDVQSATSAHWDVLNAKVGYYAQTIANLLSARVAPWCFQPKLNSPDYGQFMEVAARQNGSGETCLTGQSLSDASISQTVTLTPYLISMKSIARYVADAAGGITIATIASGTATDTFTCPPGCRWVYLFTLTGAAAIFNQPTFGIRKADVTGATGCAILFAYGQYAFEQQQNVIPQHYDLGSTCSGTLPIDMNLMPSGVKLNYEIVYYGASNLTLAVGSVQGL